MKTRPFSVLMSMLFMLTGFSIPALSSASSAPQPASAFPQDKRSTEQVPQDCTVFYASDDQVALGGNNEDDRNPRTKIWFVPPENGKYGLALVGFEDYAWQGGVNDHGLFFDGTAVRVVSVPQEPGKPVLDGWSLLYKAMTECATVDCVVQLYDRYSRGPGTPNGQRLFGDALGNSVIIEPLVNIRKEGQYQVVTNFFQSEVPPESRTDARYRIATEMLQGADHYSVNLFRNILNATHQETDWQTVYSTIYDLKQNVIYLYYFHDFDHVVTFSLKDELAKGIHSYDIPSLFPPSPAALALEKPTADQMTARQAALVQVKISRDLLATYAGTYELSPGHNILVEIDGDRLLARDPSMPWVEGTPISDTHFVYISTDGYGKVIEKGVTFQSEAGQVTGLEFDDGQGNKVAAKKLPEVVSAPPAAQAASTPSVLWILTVPLLLLGAAIGWFLFRRARQSSKGIRL